MKMTIKQLIKELQDYAEVYGKNAEVFGYFGMSAGAAKERLKEITADDEYIVDDFFKISHVNSYYEREKDIVYIALEDVKE